MKVLFIKPPSSKEPTWANYQDSKKWTWPEINKDEIKTTIFKLYRMISLLNYLGKVAEKIIATRLFFLIELIDLLNFN